MSCYSCKTDGYLREVTDTMLLIGRRRYPQMTYENKLCETCYIKLRTATQKVILSYKMKLMRKEESIRSHLTKSSSNTNSSNSASNLKSDSDTNNNSRQESRSIVTRNNRTEQNHSRQVVTQSDSTVEPNTVNSQQSLPSSRISHYSEEIIAVTTATATATEKRKRGKEIEKTPKEKRRRIIAPPDDSDEESSEPVAGPSRQDPPIRVTRTNSTEPEFRDDVPVYSQRFPGG